VAQTQTAAPFELSEYGVTLQPDARLIIMMAALDAAGFDPTPPGKEPAAFRLLVRKDQANLDAGLRQRLKAFFDRIKLPAPATAGDQAARYVSLAYALGPPPVLDAPDRSEDLPSGILEVLDFAPLVREFYKKSSIDERLPAYMRAYQVEGDRLRQPAAEMVRAVLSYLHTRPIVTTTERVRVKGPEKKKSSTAVYSTRVHDRRFYIVPDLMAAPGTINFRVIADDYYAIVPEGTDPTSSEMRRGYMQFVIDPLVLKFNKEIAAQRDQVKLLVDARTKEGATVSPDPFVVISRSLIAAADARYEESNRLTAVTNIQRRRLQEAQNDATRQTVAKEAEASRAAVADETIARLAEEYEKGAVLDFFFADRLRDFQASGFDIANFFADMVSGIDPARENKRPAEMNATWPWLSRQRRGPFRAGRVLRWPSARVCSSISLAVSTNAWKSWRRPRASTRASRFAWLALLIFRAPLPIFASSRPPSCTRIPKPIAPTISRSTMSCGNRPAWRA